jgi:hypothetical protein
MIKHLQGFKALSRGIQYAEADVLAEQDHEKHEQEASGRVPSEETQQKAAEGFEDRKAAFFAKFGATKSAPPEMGGKPDNEPNKERVANFKADADRQKAQDDAQKVTGEELKKKVAGSNVPHIVEAKRKAEQERDELKTKLEDFETKVKPSLDTKIAELTQKIESGDFSPAKEKEFNDKIAALEKEKAEKEESLGNENVKLKSRLRFYDLQNDDTFQAEYVAPVVEAHKAAMEAISGDEPKAAALQRALIANSAYLRATTPEEKSRAARERNSILSNISADMDEFAADNFKMAVRDYIRYSEKHAAALIDHEKTTAEIRGKMQKQAEIGQAQVLESWQSAFKTTKEAYKEDETLSDDEAKMAKELGIDIATQLDQSTKLAARVSVGRSTMMEAIDLIHKGRVYPVLTAKNKALQKQVKDQADLIAKLRKGSTGGGESNGSDTQQKTPEKETREEWQRRKYGANRHLDAK